MKTLKVGAIATGGRGRNAWQAHDPENGVVMTAGADISETAREDFKKQFPDAVVFDDYRKLLKLKDVGAVFISTPDYLHEEMAVAALKAGKAVYLEKPMAITIEGCDRILKTAMETGSRLFIGHNMRHFPVILKMKEIIDSGLIGEIQVGWCRHFVNYGGDAYFRDWHSEQRYATGLLLQKGAHDIDVMHWLMGGYTKSVVGMGMLSVYNRCGRRSEKTPGCAKWDAAQYPPLTQTGFSPIIDVEDHSMIMMQLDNGTQATYMQCHYSPDAERNYTFIGTQGRIENIGDAGTCEIHVWTRRGPRETPDIIYKLKPAVGGHGGADGPIVENFLNFVRFGAKTNTSPIAARNAVAAGVLGHCSMRTGCNRQDVPPLPKKLIEYFANGQIRK
ncbi:MAG: putative oxidoreductase YteT precursor [Lentisphaerae bacterium ADurb.Bin242]|nr:MAG: putative oxidoreductase YteT precursor [Lentisphaerae bacterium ADurb.Bin242]